VVSEEAARSPHEQPLQAGRSALGAPRVHHRVTGSTNADARTLALAGAPHGTLVTADEQLEGRGRGARRWHAPPGRCLLCSLVLRDAPELLSLRVGVAVAEVVGAHAMLKWPNDVLLDGRKVSGILVESRPRDRWAVAGIGINVALAPGELPAELADTAGTMGLAPGAIEPLLANLLVAIEARIAQPSGELIDAWRSRDALRGKRVSWEGGAGVVAGIDGSGRLLVDAGGERSALDAGEVHLEHQTL